MSEETAIHAHDLLALKIQDDMKMQMKQSLAYLHPLEDDRRESLFKYYETLKNQEYAINELQEKILGYRNDLMFSMKILAKPRQNDLLEEQVNMLKGKSESLKDSYESNIKKLIPLVANESHLVGLVEGIQTSQKVETHEETIMKDMNKIKMSKGLTDMLSELKNT